MKVLSISLLATLFAASAVVAAPVQQGPSEKRDAEARETLDIFSAPSSSNSGGCQGSTDCTDEYANYSNIS